MAISNITTFGTQKDSTVVEIEEKPVVTLRYTFDYDTQHPEEKVTKFTSDVREMMSKYDQNIDRIREIEDELSDLEHYMEISSFKPIVPGYKLYRKLAELRRERRGLKSENDLLRPVVTYFRTTNVLDKLGNVQGDVSKMHEIIDSRIYKVRTGILEEWLGANEAETNTETVLKLNGEEVITE